MDCFYMGTAHIDYYCDELENTVNKKDNEGN